MVPKVTELAEIERYLDDIYVDPEFFCETAFDYRGLYDAEGNAVDGPTPQQRQLFQGVAAALRDGTKPHFSIRSGHGTGKSAAMSQLAIWFLLTRPNGLIPCTAPSGHQLEDVLWKEIGRWLQRLVEPFNGLLELTSDKLRYKDKKNGMGEALARTARKENPDALQGFHAADILYLVDEASGVPEQIYQTAEGALTTPRAMSVLAGNPTRVAGTFYRSHHEDRADWVTLHWSSLGSPLVSKEYGPKLARKYGVESFVYKIRVLGEFPTGNPDALIGLEVVTAAAEREIEDAAWKHEPVVFGVDPARFGDDETGWCIRQGRKVHEIGGWGGLDTMQTAGRVLKLTKDWKPAAIFVDSIGIGSGVADYLRHSVQDCLVMDVNVSERPSDTEEYCNFRSEMWWKMKEFLEKRDCCIPDDDVLESELTTTNWSVDMKGKIRIETKAERKKRLGTENGGSPDRADALAMTFVSTIGTGHKRAAAMLMPEWHEDF